MAVVSNPDRLMEVIRDELNSLREQFADERRTQINQSHAGLSLEDLISEEDVVVTLSHTGYAKAQPLDAASANASVIGTMVRTRRTCSISMPSMVTSSARKRLWNTSEAWLNHVGCPDSTINKIRFQYREVPNG